MGALDSLLLRHCLILLHGVSEARLFSSFRLQVLSFLKSVKKAAWNVQLSSMDSACSRCNETLAWMGMNADGEEGGCVCCGCASAFEGDQQVRSVFVANDDGELSRLASFYSLLEALYAVDFELPAGLAWPRICLTGTTKIEEIDDDAWILLTYSPSLL